MPRVKVPETQSFNVKMPSREETDLICEIRKMSGSSAYIIHENRRFPLDDDGIEFIRQQSIENGRPSRVKLRGLSRAQISRIATDLQEENPGKVFVNKTLGRIGSMPASTLPRYEIIILK